MKRFIFLPAVFVVPFALFAGEQLWSQSSSSGSSNTQGAGQPAPRQLAEPQHPVKKKSTKVWTNDDMGALTGNVSVVGKPGTRSDREEQPPEKADEAKEGQAKPGEELKDGAWYRKQMWPLQAQLDSIDRQIQKLKAPKGSDSTPEGGLRYAGRFNMTPIEEQLKQLEAKKKSLQASIDDLEREARQHRIEPGELRRTGPTPR
jgi:hypothetical protein